MPRLIVEKGPDKGKFVDVSDRGSFTIGRETTAQIRLTDTMSSRLHFKITSRSDGYYIVDLNSRNGTLVNGQQIKEQLLKIGDKIQVGETLFSFLADVKEKKYDLSDQVIGGYKIIARLGRGGMGTVYKAEQLSLHRIVALKILSDELVKDKTFIKLFVQEARAAAQLNHPNIVQVYDVGKTTLAHQKKEIYYFSMELMPEGNIQDRLAIRKKLPLSQTLNMILSAAFGLEYAEKKGIIHCDIKPDNLMIGEEGIVKIGDLGLARSIKAPKTGQAEETIFGTPHYVAPERILNKTFDHRSDIYSLGSTLYRMLAGVTPYSGSSVQEIITKKVREAFPPLKQINPSLPDSICQVVEKMLKRNPDERYQTATQLIVDLDKVKADLLGIPMKKPATKEVIPTEKPVLTVVIIPLVLVLLSGLSLFAVVKHYYEENNQSDARPPSNNGAGGDTPRNGADAHEEKLAEQYFDNAERFIRDQRDLNSPVILKNGINLYKKVVDECPNSSLAPEAQVRIDEFQARLIQIEKRQQKGLWEKEAAQRFGQLTQDLEREYQDIMNKAQLSRMNEFFRTRLGQLKEFKIQYSDTAAAVRAEKRIKELTVQQARFEKTEQAYNEAEQKAHQAVVQRDFKSALGYLDTFLQNKIYHNTLYYNLAQVEIESIKAKAQADYDNLIPKINYWISQNDFDKARSLLNEILSRYGLVEIESQIKEKLTNLEQMVEAKQKEEYDRLLQVDCRIFYPLLAEALETAYQGSFKKALQILPTIQSDLKTEEYQTKLRNTLYEIECEQAIVKTLKTHSTQLNINGRLKGHPIKAIDDQGITVEIPPGMRTFLWREITTEEFYLLVSRGWNLSAKECLQLSVLILKRGGKMTQVRKLLQQTKSKLESSTSPENESILRSMNKYSQSLSDEPTHQAKKAQLIHEYANESYQAKQYAKALSGFLTLEHRFQNTRLYNRNKKDIKYKISICRKNIPK